jgi:hypothetical protein
MLIKIKDNTFNLSGEGAGITALNSQDIFILNNRFRGECSKGILVDGTNIFDPAGVEYPAPFASNAMIYFNKTAGLQSSDADIALGEKSTKCTVVGTGSESVIDNGIDNKIKEMKMNPGWHNHGPFIRNDFRTFHRMGHP